MKSALATQDIQTKDPIGRTNHCFGDVAWIWRKRSEAACPELSGANMYSKQIPIERAIPMWGGISEKGVSPIIFHENKKVKVDEWEDVVTSGQLKASILQCGPKSKRGPWTILCDNEHFLSNALIKKAHRDNRVTLWQIPARSPDLNPIEKYWSWLRRALRDRDLKDARAKRPVLGKYAYKMRVRSVMRSAASLAAAKRICSGLRKVCREVLKKKGAGTRG